MNFKGYLRPDGSIGIRNKICIIAVDECCDGIARKIAATSERAVVVTNWYTCMLGGNEETLNQMIELGKTANVAAVLVIAMGCGSILPEQIAEPAKAAGRMAETISCEKVGGTKKAIQIGTKMLQEMDKYIDGLEPQEFPASKLIVGVKCGGSDTSSGIASNPSVGDAVDKLVDLGATCIGGELFELQGCDEIIKERAVSDEVANRVLRLIENEKRRWDVEGADVETMSVGNCVGGLTTIEEKSLGALHKTGTRQIQDVLQINKDFVDKPTTPGFYLSEVTMLCGGAGVNYATLGAHIILWTSGAAGFNNAIVPVLRVSGNKELINDDIDIDVSGIMDGTLSIDEGGDMILSKVMDVARGEKTCLEDWGDSTMTLYQKDQRVESLLNIPCKR